MIVDVFEQKLISRAKMKGSAKKAIWANAIFLLLLSSLFLLENGSLVKFLNTFIGKLVFLILN
jgi:hypothetical protein